jgi:hypothetical protein
MGFATASPTCQRQLHNKNRRNPKQDKHNPTDNNRCRDKAITVATGQTLDFSGFYIWLTSNIGSAELMSLQHSNDATLERHVLTRAQQTLRPEIFARVNEKLVFHRLICAIWVDV